MRIQLLIRLDQIKRTGINEQPHILSEHLQYESQDLQPQMISSLD